MNQTTQNSAVETMVFKKPSQVKEVWRRLKKDRLAMFGLTVVVFLIIISILADVIVPYQAAIKMNLKIRLQPPTGEHWFGTDGYGRDLFARCIHGSRVSLTIGFATSFVSLIFGGFLGAFTGYVGGVVDNLIMRFLDTVSSIPSTLLAMTVVAAIGPGLVNICAAIAITSIPSVTRIVRASVLGIAEQEYIEAAKAGGTSTMRILLKHVVPNAVGPLIISTTMNISAMILTAATLSFLGLGINPPQPEWGALISEAKEFLRTAPHLMLIPGALICTAAFSMSVFGDGLRDALDPRLKS
jgi:peptide/nickel transport system permease protein